MGGRESIVDRYNHGIELVCHCAGNPVGQVEPAEHPAAAVHVENQRPRLSAVAHRRINADRNLPNTTRDRAAFTTNVTSGKARQYALDQALCDSARKAARCLGQLGGIHLRDRKSWQLSQQGAESAYPRGRWLHSRHLVRL